MNSGKLMLEVIILAGGKGTRLREVVSDRPKPMADIAGQPFLKILMHYWHAQGAQHFILSVGYMADIIIGYFGDHFEGIPISYAREDAPLGTGGGLLRAARLRRSAESYVVLNGDTYLDVHLDNFLKFHHTSQSSVTFSLCQTQGQGRYMGVELDLHNRITSLDVKTFDKPCLTNAGVYLFADHACALFDHKEGQSCSLEDDIFPGLLAKNKLINGYEHQGVFIDIGVPHDYFRAPELLLDQR